MKVAGPEHKILTRVHELCQLMRHKTAIVTCLLQMHADEGHLNFFFLISPTLLLAFSSDLLLRSLSFLFSKSVLLVVFFCFVLLCFVLFFRAFSVIFYLIVLFVFF